MSNNYEHDRSLYGNWIATEKLTMEENNRRLDAISREADSRSNSDSNSHDNSALEPMGITHDIMEAVPDWLCGLLCLLGACAAPWLLYTSQTFDFNWITVSLSVIGGGILGLYTIHIILLLLDYTFRIIVIGSTIFALVMLFKWWHGS